jgi:tRNA-specific 2-thiouridylase
MSGKKVLVGVNNSIDSKVACLLLKKQGYDVYPVAIVTADPNISEIGPGITASNCSKLDLKDLQDFSQKYSLQLFAVDAKERFNDEVVDNFLSKKLMGMKSQACFRCYNLRLQVLYDKMLKLKANFIATGHYAKIYLNKEINQYQVYRGIDTASDQSHLLGQLSQDMLSHLLLPLAEVQRENIFKIAQTLGLNPPDLSVKKLPSCFDSLKEVDKFVEVRVAADLIMTGEIVNFDTKKVVREHKGLHNFRAGDHISSVDGAIGEADKNLEVYKISTQNKAVLVRNRSKMKCTEISLCDITLHLGFARETPQDVFVKFEQSQDLYPAVVNLKNNNRIMITLKDEHTFVPIGERVVLYNREAGLSKVLVSGTVDDIGPFGCVDRITNYREEGDEQKSDDGEIFGF